INLPIEVQAIGRRPLRFIERQRVMLCQCWMKLPALNHEPCFQDGAFYTIIREEVIKQGAGASVIQTLRTLNFGTFTFVNRPVSFGQYITNAAVAVGISRRRSCQHGGNGQGSKCRSTIEKVCHRLSLFFFINTAINPSGRSGLRKCPTRVAIISLMDRPHWCGCRDRPYFLPPWFGCKM